MEEYLLQTENLTKRFGRHKAVNEISIHLPEGGIYGFIGRNGAGKTTFLKIAAGLARQTSGNITFMGKSNEKRLSELYQIGALIESPGVYGDMTAYENMKLCAICKRKNQPSYLEELLDLAGLAAVGKKKVKAFSLGMKQRLGIALALIGDPKLLILDEPINGLDPQGIVEVRNILLRLNEERHITILISSHILEELSKIATHYGIIDHGYLLEELTREMLLERCEEKLQIVTEDPQKASIVLEQYGIHKYKVKDGNTIHIYERLGESAKINYFLMQNGIMVSEISKCSENLEQYFVEKTKGGSYV